MPTQVPPTITKKSTPTTYKHESWKTLQIKMKFSTQMQFKINLQSNSSILINSILISTDVHIKGKTFSWIGNCFSQSSLRSFHLNFAFSLSFFFTLFIEYLLMLPIWGWVVKFFHLLYPPIVVTAISIDYIMHKKCFTWNIYSPPLLTSYLSNITNLIIFPSISLAFSQSPFQSIFINCFGRTIDNCLQKCLHHCIDCWATGKCVLM